MEAKSGRTSSLPPSRGFSLLATLPLVFLLILLATGMVALTTQTTRKSNKDAARNEARANARLALTLALAELQAQLGPDQRVSAPAGILDRNPETLSVEGVNHPYWVGVWRTQWQGANGGAANRTPWVRNDVEGGLKDQRFETRYDRERELLSYLVSGNAGGRAAQGGEFKDAIDAMLGVEAVPVVGPGSVAEHGQEVSAPRIATMRDGKETGGYAYWVGDLGVQAHAGLVDRYGNHNPQRGDSPLGMERLVNAQDVESEFEAGLPDRNGKISGQVHRRPSARTFDPLGRTAGQEVKRSFQALPRATFHDLTTTSQAVLANVRDGGLQRDLTAFLNSDQEIPDLRADGRIVSPGLTEQDNMTGPANPTRAAAQGTTWTQTRYREISPKFAMLRNWSAIGNELPWAQREQDMIRPGPVREGTDLRGPNDGGNVYAGSNLSPASFLPLDTPNLFPVMVEGSLYYNLASYPVDPGNPSSQYVLRLCLYPRVALWNPFDVELRLPAMVASIWVNGNKEVQLKFPRGADRIVSIPFGRGSINVGIDSRTLNRAAATSGPDPSPGHHLGWLNFMIEGITLAPGETQVFSASRAREYSIEIIARNVLTSSAAPDPTRYFYQDMDLRPMLVEAPSEFIEFPLGGVGSNASGSDNYMMSLKDATPSPRVQDRVGQGYNILPLVAYYNCSLQAGGNDELPVQWNSNSPARVHPLGNSRDRLGAGAIPDVRTRDGFRLRWWRETRSNEQGSGQLSRQPSHLQTAAIATWNPRAAYFCRTPWDNVTDQPPHFFGMFTRDLFDQDVSWQGMMPRVRDGKMLGYPFGPPLEGPDQVVLFEVPRAELGIPSLGYLRHLKLSEFGWAPSYTIGNSLVDPRVGRIGTSPVLRSSQERINHGWNQHLFGWAAGRGGGGADYWAMLFRQILFNRPFDHQVVHDLSYELNFSLWDDYFVSTGDSDRKRALVDNPARNPLLNGRMRLFMSGPDLDPDDLDDFHRAASRLMLEGGFNVHSVSVEAWKAVLASTRDTGYGSEGATPFPRILNSVEGEWLDGRAGDREAVAGFRSLSETEIDRLAQEIVREVKERAPFFGLGDFVNRRLVDTEHGDKGPIEAAISAAGINQVFDQAYPINNARDLPNVSFDNMADTTRLDQSLKPDSVAWGIPGYLTQGDLLQVIGSSLRPRSDTFMVRAYGESRGSDGKVKAQAWCEAIVQRIPDPVNPDPTGLNPEEGNGTDLGRRFRIVKFRWLNEEEV